MLGLVFVQLPPTPPAQGAAAAPWWGTPLLAGGFAIIGVALTLLGTMLTDRRKSAREAARERETDGKKRCAEFLAVVQLAHERIIDERLRARCLVGLDFPEGVSRAWADLQMSAPAVLVHTGAACYGALLEVWAIYDPSREEEASRTADRYAQQRTAFLNAARVHYNLDALDPVKLGGSGMTVSADR